MNGGRMGYAGREAQLYVPRLLSVIGSSEAAGCCFGEAWHQVPLPLLLPWVAQMLSLLDAAQGEALLPPLKVSLHAIQQIAAVLDSTSRGKQCAFQSDWYPLLYCKGTWYQQSAACTPLEKTGHVMM